MRHTAIYALAAFALASCGQGGKDGAQTEINDSTTPLHLLQPDYATPYGKLDADSVKADVDRVFAYIDRVTPAKMTDGKVNQGTYRLTSYEWGVMYDALLDAAKITGDKKYSDYVSDRIGFLARQADAFEGDAKADGQLRQVKMPLTLDDAGAMSGAWMRAAMADTTLDLGKYIESYWKVVETAPVHLADGTIARNRPHYNSVWLDDMFMALPSMAVRSQYASDPRQLDEAADIAAGFIKRMWMPEKGIFRHGYVEGAEFQPSMAWGRANGWAILTLSQLLDYLPENHPRRAELLDVFQKHAAGLARLQGIDGFWHQLLDRPETYEETSATAIFTYALAHGINQGWLDPATFGPVAQLGWEAVASKINGEGEVEDVCVGTGMGFDPAFYAYRPVSVKAAHGYGPAIWAGVEMIRLINAQHPYLNDSAIHYYAVDPEAEVPLFSLDSNGKATEVLH
ncbi:MAG: glycoside hydrolase family 88 protein [Clostridium sp.]|nr:glycoside hydrolase family 88 protein [Clostridium sp.]